MKTRPRTAFLAGAALAVAAVSAGGTYALWGSGGDLPIGTITAGDLGIELAGETRWYETSQDVRDEPAVIDPATFLVRPGDTFEIHQHFVTRLQGDNMLARLGATGGSGLELPAGVTATYAVLDGQDELLGTPVPIGAELVVDRAIAADDAGRTDDYTLVVELATTDGTTPDRFGPASDDVAVELGAIVIELQQVRDGEGFN